MNRLEFLGVLGCAGTAQLRPAILPAKVLSDWPESGTVTWRCALGCSDGSESQSQPVTLSLKSRAFYADRGVVFTSIPEDGRIINRVVFYPPPDFAPITISAHIPSFSPNGGDITLDWDGRPAIVLE